MRTSRICLHGQALAPNCDITLPEDAGRYVARVLRLRGGDPVCVFDGRGREYAATVADVDRRRVTLRLGQCREPDRESPLAVTLALGVSRGDHMDFAIQKSVELGVARIVPLLTEHCTVRLDPRRATQKGAHWQGIIVSACEQCGRNRLPVLEPVFTLADWLAAAGRDPGIVLAPGADRGPADLDPPGARLSLLVGPEGGLSAEEIAGAVEAGLSAVRLGPRVLRAETACVAALAAVQTRWGDLG